LADSVRGFMGDRSKIKSRIKIVREVVREALSGTIWRGRG
jgi:hypothetical protein